MDFEFSAEQIQLRKLVRDFAEKEIRPHLMEWDEAQIFPLEVVKKAGEMGLLGAIFPEELGGSGYGYIDYSIIIEELARVDPSVALIIAAHHSLCTNHIYLAGDKEQRAKYIPKLATGEWIGCWSLTEPEAGSDAAGTRTTAVLKDSDWVLNGGKTFTTNAQYADVCVAMAVTDRSASQHGISAFILEKGTPGFTVGKKENKLGMRASATGEVLFSQCRLPASQLLGKQGEGFVDSLRILDGGRISIAALAIGLAQGAYEARSEVRKTPKAVRTIHLGISGDPGQAGQYGDFNRGRALAHLLGWLKEGCGQTGYQGIGDGKAFRIRDGRASGRPGFADSWRLRIHQRLSGREVLSRCEALHDRRGDQRNPAACHRTPALERVACRR